MSVSEGGDGRVLFNCFAGCDGEAVLEALGMDWPELFPGHTKNSNNGHRKEAEEIDWLGELKRLGVLSPAELLESVTDSICRYVVVAQVQAWTLALYVLHTHAFEAAECSPYLAVLSPEKRCGKTLLLRVLALLVRRPWRVVSPSEAVVYRKVQRDKPTLELDEVDTIFGRNKDYEPLRALLNAGNEPDTVVPRCGGANRDQLQEFSVYCPKILAGIDRGLPETVEDRSIMIMMKRRTPGEHVERFRRRDAQLQAEPLQKLLAEWAEPFMDELAAARPDLPDELDDRASDGWEPLIAIADLAGGDWPQRARSAALEISGVKRAEDDSNRVRLLQDIKAAFEEFDSDRLPGKLLRDYLIALEESPWSDWRGKPLTARGLAQLLKPYGIRSKTVRDGEDTFKGYIADQFEDAWSRYLPTSGVTSVTSASDSQKPAESEPSQTNRVTDAQSVVNPHPNGEVTHVTDGVQE
jgi:hypothetical protein